MSDSPIRQALGAIDALDSDRLMSLFSPAVEMTMAFGQEASGREQVGVEFARFLAELRATEHRVSREWNPEPGVWVAELTATYELRDFRRLGPFRRVIVLRSGEDGIEQLRVYGNHEPPLSESSRGYENVRGPHGWLPTL